MSMSHTLLSKLIVIILFLFSVCAPYSAQGTSSIQVEKLTNGIDADTPPGPAIQEGDPVEWHYEVTNTGDHTLVDIILTDDILGSITCPRDTLNSLESMTCIRNGIATRGQHANMATVEGIDPGLEVVTATDPSHYLGYLSAIQVEKSTNGYDADEITGPSIPVGAPVIWTYQVTNIGDTELHSVSLTDSRGVEPLFQSGDTDGDTILDPGEVWVYKAEGTASLGQYGNIATAMAIDPYGNSVNDSDPSHYFGTQPEIDIEKATNGFDADQPTGPILTVGSTVDFTYIVTNVGNVPLSQIVVIDDQGVKVSCPKDILAVNESMTCIGQGVAERGQYKNIGTVTASSGTGQTCTDNDPSHYLVNKFPWVFYPIPVPQCSDVPIYCYLVADRVNPNTASSPLLKYTFSTDSLELINFLGVDDVEAIALSLDGKTYYAANGGILGTIKVAPGITNSFNAINPDGVGGGNGAYGYVQFNDIDGLAFDRTTGILYGTVRYLEYIPGVLDLLIKINEQTGKAIKNGFGPGVDYIVIDTESLGVKDTDDIAIDSDGIVYGFAGNSGGGGKDHAIIINKKTGSVLLDAPLVDSNGNAIQDFEGVTFVRDKTFYGTTGVEFKSKGTHNSLYKISKGSGFVEFISRLDRNINGYVPSDFEAITCYPICEYN